MTTWLDSPLIFQNNSKMSMWQTKPVSEKQRWARGKEKVEQQNLGVRMEKENCVPVKWCIQCFLVIDSEMESVLQAFLKHGWPKF